MFGVKDSLVVELDKVSDDLAQQYNVERGTSLLRYDFVLVTEEEAAQLRNEKSIQALRNLGRTVKIVHGLPVPDID